MTGDQAALHTINVKYAMYTTNLSLGLLVLWRPFTLD